MLTGPNFNYFSSTQVRIMRKRLVRKTFDMIEELSQRENEEVSFSHICNSLLTHFPLSHCSHTVCMGTRFRTTKNSGRTSGNF